MKSAPDPTLMTDGLDQAVKSLQPEAGLQLVEDAMRLWRQGRLHPFLLIWGREGIGKTIVADNLAATLLCQSSSFADDLPNSVAACGICPSCRNFQRGSHPDFFRIDATQGRIRTDAVDAFMEFASVHGLGSMRVALMTGVEALTKQAANRLLKTLEEPPENLHILMTTSRLRSVIGTIRSRAMPLHLKPLDFELALPALRRAVEEHQPSGATLADEDLRHLYNLCACSTGQFKNFLPVLRSLHESDGSVESLLTFQQALEQADADEVGAVTISHCGELGLNWLLRGLVDQGPKPAVFTFLRSLREYRRIMDRVLEKEMRQGVRLAEQLHRQALLWRLSELKLLAGGG